MNVIRWIDQRRHWWKVFVVIFAVSVTVVGYIGYQTYQYAPPVVDFVDEQGDVIFHAESVVGGQKVFQKYGLMDYGSYLGDGGMRGPDFTAESLNLTARWMNEYYAAREAPPADPRKQEAPQPADPAVVKKSHNKRHHQTGKHDGNVVTMLPHYDRVLPQASRILRRCPTVGRE